MCPICLTENLEWNLNKSKSHMQMFRCGHGTCNDCYNKLKNSQDTFSCPTCRTTEQLHTVGFCSEQLGSWTTFAEWYNEFEVYIKSGVANNIVRNTTFGKQLLRLIKETKSSNIKS